MNSRFGFYKVATGLFRTHVADIEKNTEEILSLIEKAKKENVHVLVFPELAVTGYTCQDLFLSPVFLKKAEQAISKIAKAVPSNLLVFIGLPFMAQNKVFNCAAALIDGKIAALVPKTYIPNNSEFYEKRWFSSANELDSEEIPFGEELVPIGTNILLSFGGLKVGCEICEDLWVIKPPSDEAALAGANLIVNLSASDETAAKKDYRRDLIRMQSSKLYAAYLYCSSGQGESSQDLVFSGHQLLFEGGKEIFDVYDQTGIHCGLIDIDRLQNDRIRNKSSFECPIERNYRILDIGDDSETDILPDHVDPHPFFVQGEGRIGRSREILSLQAKGLATRLKNIHVDKVVIGVSGGLDSTLALLVCQESFRQCHLDPKGIHAFSMPSKATSTTTFGNAKTLIEKIGCTYHEIPIADMLKQHLSDIDHPSDLYDTTYENAQARIRTLILMDQSNALGALVVGTSDLSEACLGFSTYNGDHMSMYAVNISIPKTLVRILIEDYGKDHPDLKDILTAIVETPISPELIPGKDGDIVQKTEEIIGSYDLHDFFIFHFLRNGFSKDKIAAMAFKAFPSISKDVILKTLDTFYHRFFTQQFKRSCLPDGVKVGSIAISPRGDWRMPSDLTATNSFNPPLQRKKK